MIEVSGVSPARAGGLLLFFHRRVWEAIFTACDIREERGFLGQSEVCENSSRAIQWLWTVPIRDSTGEEPIRCMNILRSRVNRHNTIVTSVRQYLSGEKPLFNPYAVTTRALCVSP